MPFNNNNKDKEDKDGFIDALLIKRGFINEDIRKSYQAALNSKYGHQHTRLLISLYEELLAPLYKVVRPNKNQSEIISVSNLANFSFCPASYALQETYDFEETDEAIRGSLMHDKQILISEKKKATKETFYEFARSGDPRNIGSLWSGVNKYIDPLLQDIMSSKLVYHGHNSDKPKLFYDKAGTLVGSPDYVFEKSDGTRFLVEEKFTSQESSTNSITTPYLNHRIQLGAYAMQLPEIKSSYGYVLYFSYHFDPFGPFRRTPSLGEAKAFRLDYSESFEREVAEVLHQIMEFRDKGIRNFHLGTLNPSKCVSCVTSELCIHKTGTKKDLRIPYDGFYSHVTPNEENNLTEIFGSFNDAKPFARKYRMAIARNPNGDGFVLVDNNKQ